MASKQTGTSSSDSDKRRSVSVATVEKWRSNNDKELSTLTWLVYDKIDRYHVSHLKCSICTRFQDKIESSRNFSRAFITGTSNLRTSAFRDHAKSDMHASSMHLLKKIFVWPIS